MNNDPDWLNNQTFRDQAGQQPLPVRGPEAALTDEQADAIADAHRWDTREGRRAMLRAAQALASGVAAITQPALAEVITVQEIWEAAGGNPGVKATKQDLLEALRQLDKVCDEVDAKSEQAMPPMTLGAKFLHQELAREMADFATPRTVQPLPDERAAVLNAAKAVGLIDWVAEDLSYFTFADDQVMSEKLVAFWRLAAISG